jgi:hypothetical protein
VGLGLLYLVYFICLIVLYVPCKWYAGVRARRKPALLSYLESEPLITKTCANDTGVSMLMQSCIPVIPSADLE